MSTIKEMSKRAKEVVAYMDEKYAKEIQKSVENSIIYNNGSFPMPVPRPEPMQTKIVVENLDSVSAIMKYGSELTAVLNFASYKYPGGGFLQGSIAQEESLCHESFLYNVLKEFSEYYAWNQENVCYGVYTNRAIFSRNICFEHKHDNSEILVQKKELNVITCAAPNYTEALWQGIRPEKIMEVMKDRIRFILNIALENEQKILILGAFGCGAFGNDAKDVAKIFKDLLETEFKDCFEKVIFAVPGDKTDYNYQVFVKVFRK